MLISLNVKQNWTSNFQAQERLYPSDSIKYFDAKIDENLNWKDYIHDIATKLNRANTLVFKSGILLVLMPWNQFTLQSLILI